MTMTDTLQRRTDAEWHKAGYEAGLEWRKFTMAHIIEEVQRWTARLEPGCVADEFTVGILQGLTVALKGKHHVA